MILGLLDGPHKSPDKMDSFKLKENVFYPKEAILHIHLRKSMYLKRLVIETCFRVLHESFMELACCINTRIEV